jgi:L-seryl-tRNA(Ser) seleniumtransferase
MADSHPSRATTQFDFDFDDESAASDSPAAAAGTTAADPERTALLRSVPKVSSVLESDAVGRLACAYGAGAAKAELRALLAGLRRRLLSGSLRSVPAPAVIASALKTRLERLCTTEGRRVINATGIILHTGLGRAPLCAEAVEALAAMGSYCLVQASVETGERSKREEKIERMLVELTGCEAATVVNNNAAATMIALNTAAAGREVVVSRGQLVEIGGSFRMPDVMALSGCILREVGTTNRTHLQDYASAIGASTGAIIRVHTSNYVIRGFASTPSIGELTELARGHDIPVIDDLGSGALVPLRPYGLPDEPLVRSSIEAGASIACFSADKLICGPQTGVIVGRREIVDRVRANVFARTFRTSKLELAALEATLLHFLNGTYERSLPLYRMLALGVDELDRRARTLIAALGPVDGVSFAVEDDTAYVGSGSAPDQGIPTKVVRIAGRMPAAELARRLRRAVPSVFGRVRDDAVVLDMRTVGSDELAGLCSAVGAALSG